MLPGTIVGRATATAILASFLLTAVGACSATSSPQAAALVSTSTIGPAGGQVSTSGIVLNVPPGALATPTSITIAVDPNGPPAGYVAFSKLFRFSPDGLMFAKPVTLSFATTADTRAGSVYWSVPRGSGYEAVPTSWVGATAAAEATHFSSGFVGLASIPGAGDAGEGGADVWAPNDGGGVDPAPLDAGAQAMGGDAAADQTADGPIDAPGDAAGTFLSGEIYNGAPASVGSGSTLTVTASEFSSEPDGDGGCTAEQPTGQQQVTVPASALPYVYRFHFYSMTSSVCEGRRYVVEASESDAGGGLLSSAASTCSGQFGTARPYCDVSLPVPTVDAGDDASDAGLAPEASADAGDPWTQPIHFSGTVSGNVPSGASFIRVQLDVAQGLLGLGGCNNQGPQMVNYSVIAPTLPATYSFTFGPELTPDGGTAFCLATFTLKAYATDATYVTLLAGSTAGTTYCGHVGSGAGPPIQSTSVTCDVSLP